MAQMDLGFPSRSFAASIFGSYHIKEHVQGKLHPIAFEANYDTASNRRDLEHTILIIHTISTISMQLYYLYISYIYKISLQSSEVMSITQYI